MSLNIRAKQCANLAPLGSILGTLVAALFVVAIPFQASADKVFYKGGRIIEGAVQEEYPSRIKFLVDGREILIPRSRIEKIERDATIDNVRSMIERAAQAIEQGDANRAQKLLDNALALKAPETELADQYSETVSSLQDLRSKGSSEQRRRKAAALILEANEEFDRVQTTRGIELLLEALRIDPTFAPAHESMSNYIRDQRTPPVILASDYFVRFVDPDTLDKDHAIIPIFPQVFVSTFVRLSDAQNAIAIDRGTSQLTKLSDSFAQHPDWHEGASDYEAALIGQGAEKLIMMQIERDLGAGNYEVALLRLRAWGEPDQNLETQKAYIRSWVGSGNFDRAKTELDAVSRSSRDLVWAEKSRNVLEHYIGSIALIEARDRGVASLITRLFAARNDVLPEVFNLVARAKASYDFEDAKAMQTRGDTVSAADRLIRIFEYSADRPTAVRARSAFEALVPDLKYDLKLRWIVDGEEILLHKESSDIVKTLLGQTPFSLSGWDPKSPFRVEITLTCQSYNGTGRDLAKAAKKKNVWEVKLIEDEFITKLRVSVRISHSVSDDLYFFELASPGVFPRAKSARTDPLMGIVYFDLGEMKEFDKFLDRDLALYLPVELGYLEGKISFKWKNFPED